MKKELKDREPLKQAQQRLEEVRVRGVRLVDRLAILNSRIRNSHQEIGRKYLAGDRSGIRDIAEWSIEVEAVESALQLLAVDRKVAEIEVERAKQKLAAAEIPSNFNRRIPQSRSRKNSASHEAF
ncbi:MAG: hypothetical protein ACR2JB_19115 [Bryobacteraceae bacterium]